MQDDAAQLVRWGWVSFPYAVEVTRRRREAVQRPLLPGDGLPVSVFSDAMEWLGELAGRFDGEEWDQHRRRRPTAPGEGAPQGNPNEHPKDAPKGG